MGSDMDRYGIVVFEVRQDTDGLFTATSPDLAGVCVAHRNLDKIVEDMPNIMRLWFKRHKGIDIRAYQGPTETSAGTVKIPVIPVPAEIAAQALAR